MSDQNQATNRSILGEVLSFMNVQQDQAINQSINQSMQQPINQSMQQPIHQLNNQSIGQYSLFSNSQPVNRPVYQPIGPPGLHHYQSNNDPIYQSNNDPIYQSNSHLQSQSRAPGPIGPPPGMRTNQSINQHHFQQPYNLQSTNTQSMNQHSINQLHQAPIGQQHINQRQPINQLNSQSVHQLNQLNQYGQLHSANQNRPVNQQSINQSISQSNVQLAYQQQQQQNLQRAQLLASMQNMSLNQSTNQINQLIDRGMNEQRMAYINQSTNQSLNQSNYQTPQKMQLSRPQSGHQSNSRSSNRPNNQSLNLSVNDSQQRAHNLMASPLSLGDSAMHQSQNQSNQSPTNRDANQQNNRSSNQSNMQTTNQASNRSPPQSTDKSNNPSVDEEKPPVVPTPPPKPQHVGPSKLTAKSKPHYRRPPQQPTSQSTNQLDTQLTNLLHSLVPSDAVMQKREACRAEVEYLISQVWPDAKLKLFGSSVNLLCDVNSDLDLSLVMDESTRVKQSCYNTFKPKPKPEKKEKSENEDQSTDQPTNQSTNSPAKETETPVKKPPASPSLSGEQIPLVDLSNPADLAKLKLEPVGDDEFVEPGQAVEKLAMILRSSKLFTEILALPNARVPIVKFRSVKYALDCDIGINNLLAVENSGLIRSYMLIDPRVRQLVYIVKYWAKQRKINDPYRGTLSSYAYCLLVIHFCQVCQPPLLPCLQAKRDPVKDVRMIADFDCFYRPEWPESERPMRNNASLGSLLMCFMSYYAHSFDYHDDVICVRLGGVLEKASKAAEWASSGKRDKHLLSIEDPFEITHDLGRVCDANALFEIRGEMIRAAKMIQDRKKLSDIVAKYEKEWRGS